KSFTARPAQTLSGRRSGARAKPANPESITTVGGYGFRLSPLSRVGRNDELNESLSLAVTIAPARQAAGPRLGFEDAAGDGARQRGGRDGAKLGAFGYRIGKGHTASRRGEYRAAVERRMGRVYGAREPVLRDDGKLFGLRLGQRCVRCDDRDSRILARPPLRDWHERGRRHARRKAEPAKLAIHFEGGRPEMRPGADLDPAAAVDDDEGADRVSVTRHRGGRAEPALEVDRGGAA